MPGPGVSRSFGDREGRLRRRSNIGRHVRETRSSRVCSWKDSTPGHKPRVSLSAIPGSQLDRLDEAQHVEDARVTHVGGGIALDPIEEAVEVLAEQLAGRQARRIVQRAVFAPNREAGRSREPRAAFLDESLGLTKKPIRVGRRRSEP